MGCPLSRREKARPLFEGHYRVHSLSSKRSSQALRPATPPRPLTNEYKKQAPSLGILHASASVSDSALVRLSLSLSLSLSEFPCRLGLGVGNVTGKTPCTPGPGPRFKSDSRPPAWSRGGPRCSLVICTNARPLQGRYSCGQSLGGCSAVARRLLGGCSQLTGVAKGQPERDGTWGKGKGGAVVEQVIFRKRTLLSGAGHFST